MKKEENVLNSRLVQIKNHWLDESEIKILRVIMEMSKAWRGSDIKQGIS